ncbi:MAG TPA: methylated-DNA--[protein]-cysteine S-methyltransferase [Phycisphaerae bacterium]|nr:methylated-DNA--[protein]-cysteine S-methyltransferase [Phycisphaerae bacterium]
MVRYSLVPTSWGPFLLVMQGERVLETKLPDESDLDRHLTRLRTDLGAVEDDCAHPPLQESIQRYFEGAPGVRFQARLVLDGMTEFQKAIIRACRTIGYGKTLSYGELAKRAGFPGAARAVGSVMSSNRHPLITPCHRVVAAGNRIGGFSSSSGTELKRALLELEGATVSA